MYITLEQAKQQCNLDSTFNDDDTILLHLINVCETSVELHINQKLIDIANANDGVLPIPLLQAMLILTATFYGIRESITFAAKVQKIPLSYEYLLDFYQKY